MHPVMTEMLAVEQISGMPGKAGRSIVSDGDSGRL
jgi:hypothetical protein